MEVDHHTSQVAATEQAIAGDLRAYPGSSTAHIYDELCKLRSVDTPRQFQQDVAKINGDIHGAPSFLHLPPVFVSVDSRGLPQVTPENGAAQPDGMNDASQAPDAMAPSNGAVNYADTSGIDRRRFYIAQPNGYSCGPTSLTEALFDFQATGGDSGISFDGATFADPAKREAARAAIERASGEPSSNIGNINNVSELARRFGLQSINHFGDTNLADLDRALSQGHGAIVNVPHHFVYIAGKAANGDYIVGDPADSHHGTWSPERMQAELTHSSCNDGTPTGFAEVWNGSKPPHSRVVSTDNPDGTTAANLSGGGGSGFGGYGGDGGGGGGGDDGGSGGDGGASGGGDGGGGSGGAGGASDNSGAGGGCAANGGGAGTDGDGSDNADSSSPEPNSGDPSCFDGAWGGVTDDQDGEAAVMSAFSQQNVPYKYGGECAGEGFDCSGLTAWAWEQHGVKLPHNAQAQFEDPHVQHIQIQGANGQLDFSKLKPGDLLFYKDGNSIGHVTMFAGASPQGKPLMIEAPQPGQNVCVTQVRTAGLVMEAGRPHK